MSRTADGSVSSYGPRIAMSALSELSQLCFPLIQKLLIFLLLMFIPEYAGSYLSSRLLPAILTAQRCPTRELAHCFTT